MSKGPTPKEVRAARSWLYRKGLTVHIVSPRRLAAAAKEMDKSFAAVFKLLAGLYKGTQGQGPFPKTAEALQRGEA